jgi:FKBP-type peptidyl-prolyl cis-trans isomerase
MNKLVIPVSILLLSVSACNKSGRGIVSTKKPGEKEMVELNSYIVEKDRERIISYAERKNLKMKESKSGLWYLIRNPGTGVPLRENDRVVLEYRCSLLDGTLCYSSDSKGTKEVVVGKSEIESGLNEGLRMLGRGGEALFILPPFLGYGLLGDNNAIPPRATLVYEIKIADK